MPFTNTEFSSVSQFKAAFKSRDYVLNFADTLLKMYPTISRAQFLTSMQDKFKGGDYLNVFNALVLNVFNALVAPGDENFDLVD